MIVAVASCWKYRDAWHPFFTLLNHFWPDHPDAYLASDQIRSGDQRMEWNAYMCPFHKETWRDVVYRLTEYVSDPHILLLQEDFFLNASVQTALVEHGRTLLQERGAGCVRLYPCPGGEQEIGDPYFAEVPRGTAYRVSCQAAIWDAGYLQKVLMAAGDRSPADFEVLGTRAAEGFPEPVLAFKRAVEPWPIQYLCSAINRGLWNPDAKRLCDRLGIEADFTMRGFQPA